jgi:hypothetical protein
MIADRLASLMHRLADNTVLADLLQPVERALQTCRQAASLGRTLGMREFLTLGVLRHLQGTATVREQIQTLLHLAEASAERVPLARSTWSDALASPARLEVLQAILPAVAQEARRQLPDRLADIPYLGSRPVFAADGTYQRESVHYRGRAPKDGGTDNPKGHAHLTFYDVRLGVPVDVAVETRNRHETAILRDYDRSPAAVIRQRSAICLLDRAFVDAPFWDAKKRALGIVMITRLKSNLRIDSTEDLGIDASPVNAGVEKNLRVVLASSRAPWRLIVYRSRRGHVVEFLTNDFDLPPGVVAFLYSRRWEEEKCFDTWKNDFAMGKAWAKSRTALDIQARLAVLASVLVAMLLVCRLGPEGSADDKALKRQARRQAKKPEQPDGTDRPDWTVALFRSTSKVSRQVLRFFKTCFLRPASQGLYQRELRPLLAAYL